MDNNVEFQILSGFHAVTFFREVKERIAAETAGMSFEQLKRYIAERAGRGSHEKFERGLSKDRKCEPEAM
jgi:hypothetical protein